MNPRLLVKLIRTYSSLIGNRNTFANICYRISKGKPNDFLYVILIKDEVRNIHLSRFVTIKKKKDVRGVRARSCYFDDEWNAFYIMLSNSLEPKICIKDLFKSSITIKVNNHTSYFISTNLKDTLDFIRESTSSQLNELDEIFYNVNKRIDLETLKIGLETRINDIKEEILRDKKKILRKIRGIFYYRIIEN